MMNFLLDQGLPRTTVTHLKNIGLNAQHVGQLGMATALDKEILDKARQDNFIVVTLDSDFHSLLALDKASKPSVVRIRIEGLKGKDVANIIKEVVEASQSELKNGAAVSVTQSAIRVRLLPLA
jgi:predicted nuclease of predicted toxin-antitoxin system